VARRTWAATDFTVALIEGPWSHRFVSASGLRFHVACAGPADGLPVILLHDLPQHWWATRHLLTRLSEAGHRCYALDLRGCGASDKPPEGYALPMLARDVAAVIAALGHRAAVVVGHGFGGLVAWTMATRAPDSLVGIVPVCAHHPGSLLPKRRLLVSPRAAIQLGTLRSPTAARRLLPQPGFMSALLATWAADPAALDPAAAGHYAEAMRIPFAADKAARMTRWATRPLLDAAHARFVASARLPTPVPVLHIHTDRDPLLRWTVAPAEHLGGQDYTFELLHDVGHLAPEEAPDELALMIAHWLALRGFGRRSSQGHPADGLSA
jgi:pimeloyl-ACP methyl ester carboxylesterase